MEPVIITSEEVSPSFTRSSDKTHIVAQRHPGAPTHRTLLESQGCAGGLCLETQHYQFLAPQPLTLMPYLDSLYTYGNNIIQPGALINSDPISQAAQYVKVNLSRIGISYSGQTPIGFTGFSGPRSQDSRRTYTSFHTSIVGKLILVRDKRTGGGLFATAAVKQGDGFGYDLDEQNPQKNIGGITNPAGYYQRQGIYINQVALGGVAYKGKLVVLAGMLDLGNTMDRNAHSNTGSNELSNKAFVNTAVLPVTVPGLGAQVVFQPNHSVYMILASVSNNTPPNVNPFHYVNGNHWSNIAEVGFIRDDVFGLGKGVYRFQPYYTTTYGHAGFGVAMNIQQELGKNNPYGWFLRAGVSDSDAAKIVGVKCSAATGFVVMSPFSIWKKKNPKAVNREYVGLGVMWSEAARHIGKINKNEYGVELTYVMQLTPTMTIQPDIQVIKDPIYAKKQGQTNVVFQFQTIWQY